MRTRDPRDPNYPKRFAGSYAASLFLHALAAALLFTVATNSSEPGTSESVAGGEVVTVTQEAVGRVQPSAMPNAQPPPQPHVAAIAPVRHAQPRAAAQPQPQQRHELTKEVSKAPPNPQPVPQASAAPVPVPTQPVVEPSPALQIPAAPISVPSVPVIAVAVKTPQPTAAPIPVPAVLPTRAPTPRPRATALPTRAPATPSPVAVAVATASPSPRPAVASPSATPPPRPAAVATARPTATPVASAPPAVRSGVPSPSPAATPGPPRPAGTPRAHGAEGHARAGTGGALRHTAAPRPVAVAPTPSPPPRKHAIDLNAKLNAMIPTGPVHVTRFRMAPGDRSIGSLDPTPPPDVLARTKYIYETTGSGNEARTKMWVTEVHSSGLFTTCTGWLVRWPIPPAMQAPGPAPNGTNVVFGGRHQVLGSGMTGIPPIVEGIVTYTCAARALTPFTPASAPSPTP